MVHRLTTIGFDWFLVYLVGVILCRTESLRFCELFRRTFQKIFTETEQKLVSMMMYIKPLLIGGDPGCSLWLRVMFFPIGAPAHTIKTFSLPSPSRLRSIRFYPHCHLGREIGSLRCIHPPATLSSSWSLVQNIAIRRNLSLTPSLRGTIEFRVVIRHLGKWHLRRRYPMVDLIDPTWRH